MAAMDERHDTPSGPMIKKLCERAYTVFAQPEYERLANISVAHLYNLIDTLTLRQPLAKPNRGPHTSPLDNLVISVLIASTRVIWTLSHQCHR